MTADSFKKEIAAAVKSFDKHIVCLEKSPEEFQAALDKNAKAKAFYATLNSANRYAILFRIQTAKKAETRTRRIQQFITMLAQHDKLH